MFYRRQLSFGLSNLRHVSRALIAGYGQPTRQFTSTSIAFQNMGNTSTDLQSKLRALHKYSACDVSDALLKLQKTKPGETPRAGHLADLIPFVVPSPAPGTGGSDATEEKVIAPASTFKFVSKQEAPEPLAASDPTSIPKGSHWVDLTEPGTIVVIDQPAGQKCASIGGIMAERMKVRGIAGCVVGGRVRDLAELKKTALPVFALAKSTVGTGAEATPYARNVQVSITGVPVSPGDIIFCDPLEGVVVIPQDLLDQTLELMPVLIAADDKVKDAVSEGMAVAEAFKKFRA